MIAEPSTTKTSIEAVIENGADRIIWVTGSNFSGRSAILLKICGRFSGGPAGAISIPPEIDTVFSALVPTVKEELLLHSGKNPHAPILLQLARKWGLESMATRDPYSLSGGEKSLLAILCKLALGPTLLAVDGALEQLDPRNLKEVLSVLSSNGTLPQPPRVVLTNNANLPSDTGADIRQVRASDFSEIERPEQPPPLNLSGFNPSKCEAPQNLILKDISFRYSRNNYVFKGLNLTLKPGCIYRLAGFNGSGKSTLARILTGILPLNDGVILVNGTPFNSYAQPGTLARLHFQSPDSQLFDDTVAKEFNSLPPAIAERAAHFAGLSGFLDQHPFDLPFVLRKRLALTLILHTSAPWLIFDEPTLGQDEQSRAVLSSAFRKLAECGYGIILVSHNEMFANLVTDKTIPLEKIRNEHC